MWEGSAVPASTITYGMMAAGRMTWSDEKFLRSQDEPSKRRYSLLFAIPHQPIKVSLLLGVLSRLLDFSVSAVGERGYHQPLVSRERLVFEYDLHFKARGGLLLAGLERLSKTSKATWKVRDSSVSAVGERGYEVVKLLASGGVETLRSWIGKQRRIVNTSGSKAWSLSEPLC